jgi:hypothetical protein
MFTVILMEGKRPKRAVGRFPTRQAAEAWARADGWEPELFIVIPFVD